MSASLFRAAALQPDPPCVAFNCSLLHSCAAGDRACQAFAVYVSTGRVVSPLSIMRQTRNRRLELIGMRDGAPMPTEKIYQRLYARVDLDDKEIL